MAHGPLLAPINGTPTTLAQAGNAPVLLHEILPLLVTLLVLSIVGGLVILYLRKRMFADDKSSDSAGLFADLRAMRDRGEISDDEYERTRAVIIAKATGKDAEQVRADAIRKAGGRVAEPGFDLSGRPLPGTEPPGPENPLGSAPDNDQ